MPMDDADFAQKLTEGRLEKTLKSRQLLTIPFSGSCLSCGDPVVERRFCDADCRETHEHRRRQRVINPSLPA